MIAANFQNELPQIKRRLLQIKKPKVCARTEGRRSRYSESHIFYREAVVVFSWPVGLFGQIS